MLTAVGVAYEAVSTNVEELREGGSPEALVLANARRKALAGLELAGAGEGDVALGVDTEVVLDGRALGKAATAGEARERLRALSGRTHEVLSAVALVSVEPLRETPDVRRQGGAVPPVRAERSGIASTLVTFTTLDEQILDRYLASGEWRDRAGAYAIQGLGSTLVGRIEGEFSNVVGLPLQLLLQLAPELFPPISSDSTASAPKP